MSTEHARIEGLKRGEFRPSLDGGRLPRAHALGLAISGSLLAITGVMLSLFRYVLSNADVFSAFPHPWWRYVVMVHVLSVPIFFFFAGSIWWRHVVRHWRVHQRRVSGGVVVAVSSVTALSGYILYFVGSERGLETGRLVHSGGGLLAIVIYTHHAILGWRALRSERMERR